MARSRNRQRGTHYTGVLRRDRTAPERTAPAQIETPKGFNWRYVSGVMILLLSAVLFLFFYSDAFYVRSIRVGNVNYVTIEEVFTYADIANYHVFWLSPEAVAQNVERYPSIADATVRIGWPPHLVTITVEEREPAIIWEQNGVAFWIDIHGNVMDMRAERLDLVRIVVDDPYFEGPIGDANGLDTDVVYGVLQLHDIRPEIAVWRYDPVKGLGWRNENGWDVWFGVGMHMAEKMAIYERLASDIIAKGTQPDEINLVQIDDPFYTVLWGR